MRLTNWKNRWRLRIVDGGNIFYGRGHTPEESMHAIYVKTCILDLLQFEITYFAFLSFCL